MSRLGRRVVPRLPMPESPFTLCCDIAGLKRECVFLAHSSLFISCVCAPRQRYVRNFIRLLLPVIEHSIPCQLGRQTFKWLAALCAQIFVREELRGSRGVSVREVTNEVRHDARKWQTSNQSDSASCSRDLHFAAIIGDFTLQRGDALMPGEMIGHFCRDRDVVRIHIDVDASESQSGADAPTRSLWQLFANTPEEAWEEFGANARWGFRERRPVIVAITT
jgi:hypothetical protein